MELLFFYQPTCPYCRRAESILTQLTAEHPAYGKIKIRRVNEFTQSALAAKYDYYYVPSFFLGDKKLYETEPGESEQSVVDHLTAVLDAAAKEA